MLYNGCSTVVGSSSGVIVQKIVIPTNEPSHVPTFSGPTEMPTISEPTGFPSVTPTKMPTSSSPSFIPTSSIPTNMPTVSEPTKTPTDSPSSAPSNWYDPRWEEFSSGATTCSRNFKISRTCKRGCSYSQCKNSCAENSRCRYFFFRQHTGFCMLYNGCSAVVGSSSGVIVQKIVIPTNEPSHVPTFSDPTEMPTISEPTGFPSVTPTKMPTSSSPSFIPTSSIPTNMPTVSEPTKTPTDS